MKCLAPFDRGDDFEYEFDLQDDLTSADIEAAWFTVRTAIPSTATTSDAGAIAQATLDSGITWLSETTGKVAISRTLTTTWEPGRYYCDLQLLLANGKLKTAEPGPLELRVRGDVTRTSP